MPQSPVRNRKEIALPGAVEDGDGAPVPIAAGNFQQARTLKLQKCPRQAEWQGARLRAFGGASLGDNDLETHCIGLAGGDKPDEPAVFGSRKGPRQQIDHDLANGPALAEKLEVGGTTGFEGDIASLRLGGKEAPGFRSDGFDRDRLRGALHARARQQGRHGERVLGGFQELASAVADVAGVFAIARVSDGSEQLGVHDVGKADDGIERGAQIVAHLSQERHPGFALRRICDSESEYGFGGT